MCSVEGAHDQPRTSWKVCNRRCCLPVMRSSRKDRARAQKQEAGAASDRAGEMPGVPWVGGRRGAETDRPDGAEARAGSPDVGSQGNWEGARCASHSQNQWKAPHVWQAAGGRSLVSHRAPFLEI